MLSNQLNVADIDPETGECTLVLQDLDKQKKDSWYEYFKSQARLANFVRLGQFVNGIASNAIVNVVEKFGEDATTYGIVGVGASYAYTGATDGHSLYTTQKRIQKLQEQFILALAYLPQGAVISYKYRDEADQIVNIDRNGKSAAELREEQKKVSATMLKFLETKGSITISLRDGIQVTMIYNSLRSKKVIVGGAIACVSSMSGMVISILFLQEAQTIKQNGSGAIDPGLESGMKAVQCMGAAHLLEVYQGIAKMFNDQEENLFLALNSIIDKIYVQPKQIYAIPQAIMDLTKEFVSGDVYAANIIAINRHIAAYNTRQTNTKITALEQSQQTATDKYLTALTEQSQLVSAKQEQIDSLKGEMRQQEEQLSALANELKAVKEEVQQDKPSRMLLLSSPSSSSLSSLIGAGDEEEETTKLLGGDTPKIQLQ